MVILAYPLNLSDPHYINWSWDTQNPVVYSETTPSFPPGRDPTEFWKCGNITEEDKYCLGYATQLSEGCPCSGISGIAIFSALYNTSIDTNNINYNYNDKNKNNNNYDKILSNSWYNWKMEGYLLNDTSNAVMWECPDLFPLFNETENSNFNNNDSRKNLWMVKYSIGPGPSYDQPWGTPGPRDYYLTGTYSPNNDILSFNRNIIQWEAAMNRSTLVTLDVGTFYASKTYYIPSIGRLLWGWIPEERNVDSHGNPYGWAGVMSLPRLIIPYQIEDNKNEESNINNNNQWYIRTIPYQDVLDSLYIKNSIITKDEVTIVIPSNTAETEKIVTIENINGNQYEVIVYINVDDMYEGDSCGVRVLSSITNNNYIFTNETEYTDVGIRFTSNDNNGKGETYQIANFIHSYIDTTYSTYNQSSLVNRTYCNSYPLNLSNNVFIDNINGNRVVKYQIIVDHSVIESFLSTGSRVITRRSYPSSPTTSINIQLFGSHSFTERNTTCKFSSLKITKLRNANITEYKDSIYHPDKSSSNSNNNELSTTVLAVIIIFTILGSIGIISLITYYFISKKTKQQNGLDKQKILESDYLSSQEVS